MREKLHEIAKYFKRHRHCCYQFING
ncbi:hypothetical protein [Catenovulum agarivorans]